MRYNQGMKLIRMNTEKLIERHPQMHDFSPPEGENDKPMESRLREIIATLGEERCDDHPVTSDLLDAIDGHRSHHGCKKIGYIIGRPGTGKTTEMARLVKKKLMKDRDATFLVVSNTNIAVNRALSSISSFLVVDAGMGRIAEALQGEEPMRRLHELFDAKDVPIMRILSAGQEGKSTKWDIPGSVRFFPGLKHTPFFMHPVTGCTFSSLPAALGRIRNGGKHALWDYVIVEEASTAHMAEVILASSICKKRLILIGDNKQLPSIPWENNSEDNEKDVFSMLHITWVKRNTTFSPSIIMRKQERIPKEIDTFVSKSYYRKDHGNRAVHGGSRERKKQPRNLFPSPLEVFDYGPLNLESAIVRLDSRKRRVHYNYGSAALAVLSAIRYARRPSKPKAIGKDDLWRIIATVAAAWGKKPLDDDGRKILLDACSPHPDARRLLDFAQEVLLKSLTPRKAWKLRLVLDGITKKMENDISIGIVTPYRSQAMLMESILHDAAPEEACRITVATINKFQGDERDIIIVDLTDTESSGKGINPFLLNKKGVHHGSLDRLVNVAITRAREKALMMGDFTFFEREMRNSMHTDDEAYSFRMLLPLLPSAEAEEGKRSERETIALRCRHELSGVCDNIIIAQEGYRTTGSGFESRLGRDGFWDLLRDKPFSVYLSNRQSWAKVKGCKPLWAACTGRAQVEFHYYAQASYFKNKPLPDPSPVSFIPEEQDIALSFLLVRKAGQKPFLVFGKLPSDGSDKKKGHLIVAVRQNGSHKKTMDLLTYALK